MRNPVEMLGEGIFITETNGNRRTGGVDARCDPLQITEDSKIEPRKAERDHTRKAEKKHRSETEREQERLQ